MRREAGIAVALVCICLLIGGFNQDFWSSANLLNSARQISMLGIYSIGMAFVVITGGIDLSVGSIVGLTGVIIATLITRSGEPPVVAVAVAVAISVTIGLSQGLLITRLNLQPFIVTLAGMLLLRGVSQTICNGGTISLGASPFRDLADSGFIEVHGEYLLSYPVLIFMVTIGLGGYLLHYTVFGRYAYAIGGNREAALYSGVSVKQVELGTYVISAALAGVAGVVYAAYIGQMSHTVGTAYELVAIAAVVLGGCSLRGGEGSILGVVIGSALMKVIENGINLFKIDYHDSSGVLHEWRLNTNWQYIVIGGVILLAVILDQTRQLRAQKIRRGKSSSSPEVARPTPDHTDAAIAKSRP
ncbi:MAG TPA: ABC transporter permease [Terriglobales bacterium]|nr:ABC transporter permease [Terriglobales bacterium]